MDSMSHPPAGRSRASGLASWALALALPASCADHATTQVARDAAVLTDRAVDSPSPDDLGDVGAPPDDHSVPDDIAIGDAADVPDGGVRLEVPIDPMGVPLPGSECTSDAGVRPGDPAIAPPRPILPQSVSRVTSQRPSFRWVLPAGTTGARVEVCADRCCTRVIATLDAEGTTVRPTASLPPGVVYWRMFGRAGGATGSRASYTWEFEVRRRDTPVDSSWGTIRDFTGDGYDDMVLFAAATGRPATSLVSVVEGGPAGPGPARSSGVASPAQPRATRVGDFNGDGMADIAYTDFDAMPERAVNVLAGYAGGLRPSSRLELAFDSAVNFSSVGVTDWNGDGYSDLVVSVFWRGLRRIEGSVLVVYHGSPFGLAVRPQEMHRFGPLVRPSWVQSQGELGDLDQDGYGDVFAQAGEYGDDTRFKFVLHGQSGGAPRVEAVPDPPTGSGTERYFDIVFSDPAGDIDGDGRPDFVLWPLSSATVLVYRSSSGLASPASSLRALGASFGYGISGGDLNGDGFADLLISSWDASTETWMGPTFPFNRGRMYVYFGRPSGVAPEPIWFDRVRPTDPADNPWQFALLIASPGDLDGDGVDDAAIFDYSRNQICFVWGSRDVSTAHLGGCSSHPGSWAAML